MAYKVQFCIADVSPLQDGAKFNCKTPLFTYHNSAMQLDLGDTKMQLDVHVYSLFVTYRPHF